MGAQIEIKPIDYRTNTLLGAIDVTLMLITAPISRFWFNRWGATEDERTKPLPGDEYVPNPRLSYTRAISIHAPAKAIWPWLVQMGQGRGGLYSYDGLENLVGCQIYSANRILPEHQTLKAGDAIRFGPEDKNFPGQIVAEIQPEHSILMFGRDPVTRQAVKSATWLFVLEEQGNGMTRLLIRGRNGYASGLANHILWHIFEPIVFVMERKMLRGIKARVENGSAPHR